MSASVIGIDLRATKVAVAPLRDGQLGEPLVQPTERSDSATLIDQLAAMVESARTDHLLGAGIGVPRIVEFETGGVVSTARPAAPSANGAVDLPLADVPLRQELGERLGVPVFVDNDANVAALAEAHDEEPELVARHLVMFIVGTGVGGGLVLGGRIYRGATGPASSDIRSSLLISQARSQRRWDFRNLVRSECGLRPRARSTRGRGRKGAPRVSPRPSPGERQEVLGALVVEAALEGDESAARMVEVWGQRIGIGVANAIHTFDPEEIVIGGDAARAGALLLEPARRVALEYVLPGLGAHAIVPASRYATGCCR